MDQQSDYPLPRSRHLRTRFIQIESRRCHACWKCVETCPNDVLGKVSFFKHRHARVDHPEACKGCKRCVSACPNSAIRYLYVPSTHTPGDAGDEEVYSKGTREIRHFLKPSLFHK